MELVPVLVNRFQKLPAGSHGPSKRDGRHLKSLWNMRNSYQRVADYLYWHARRRTLSPGRTDLLHNQPKQPALDIRVAEIDRHSVVRKCEQL